MNLPETYNLAQDILTPGRITSVTGGRGTGKSVFMTQLAVCANGGCDLFGMYTPPAKVLYVCLGQESEEIMREAASMLDTLGATCPDEGGLIITKIDPEGITSNGLATKILRDFSDYRPGLVILDPINLVSDGGDSASADILTKRLRFLCHAFECAVVCPHFPDELAADHCDIRVDLGSSADVSAPREVYIATRSIRGTLPFNVNLEYPVFVRTKNDD